MIFLYKYVLLVLSGSVQCINFEFQLVTPINVPVSIKDDQKDNTGVMKEYVMKHTEDLQINNPSNTEDLFKQKELKDMGHPVIQDTAVEDEASKVFLNSMLKTLIKDADDFVKNMTVKDKVVSRNNDFVDVGNYDYEDEAIKGFLRKGKNPISVKVGMFEPEFENYGQKRFGVVVKPFDGGRFSLLDAFKDNRDV